MAFNKRPKAKSVGLGASSTDNVSRLDRGYDSYRSASPEAFERMRFFLREIGQGPRAGRDLTREEAREAMSLILSQQATAAQAGGFLLVQRYKGESPEELIGFAEAIRESARIIAPKVERLIDIGSPYDGRKKSIVVSPASAIVVAAAGVPVVTHGEKRIGPKFGVPIGDVLEALAIDIDGKPEDVEHSIEETGFGFMRQAHFVPHVFALRELRTEIALRTCLSTIEKIYNLAGAPYSLLGLSHLPYAEKMLSAASEMRFKRVMIVQGIEGNEDAPTSRPCRAFLWESVPSADQHSPLPRTGSVSAVEEGPGVRDSQEVRIDPSDYGLQPATREEMAGGDAAENARIAEAVLSGESGGHRDLVLLNAGLRIWLAERATSIGEGISKARDTIDSGAAQQKLDQLRASTH
jgi:anthranilate phosphoribosyltransferase